MRRAWGNCFSHTVLGSAGPRRQPQRFQETDVNGLNFYKMHKAVFRVLWPENRKNAETHRQGSSVCGMQAAESLKFPSPERLEGHTQQATQAESTLLNVPKRKAFQTGL